MTRERRALRPAQCTASTGHCDPLSERAARRIGQASLSLSRPYWRLTVVVALLLGLMLTACSKPQLDTGSDRRFQASVAEVKAALPQDARRAFDEALVTLARAYPSTSEPAVATKPTTGAWLPRLSPELRQRLAGKTGRQVIALAAEWTAHQEASRKRAEAAAEARARQQALEELRTLRAKLTNYDSSVMDRLVIEQARLVPPESKPEDQSRREDNREAVRAWLGGSTPEDQTPHAGPMELPQIELSIRSDLRDGVYAVLLEVELLIPGEPAPWLRFQTKQRFSHGLFYGGSARRRIMPDTLAEAFVAHDAPAPETLVLILRPVRLFGADDEVIAAADISAAELDRLQQLVSTLSQGHEAKDASAAASLDARLAGQADQLRREREAALARAYRDRAESLRAERAAAAAAHAPFKRFLVDQARFYWSDHPIHRKPVLELRVQNGTGQPIHHCVFKAELTSHERDRPWVSEHLQHRFRDGLAPGETRDIRILPNWLGPWGGAPKDRSDLQLSIQPERLLGHGRQPLFVDQFTPEKAAILAEIEATIAENGWSAEQ